MADREKLYDLMMRDPCPSPVICSPNCKYYKSHHCHAERYADHLIANGVVVAKMETTTDKDNNVPSKCDYCQEFDDPCGVPMIAEEDSEPDRGIYLYNGYLCANGGEFCEAKVYFCPMCGRKLPEPPKGE